MPRSTSAVDAMLRWLCLATVVIGGAVVARPLVMPTAEERDRARLVGMLGGRSAETVALAERLLAERPDDPWMIAVTAMAIERQPEFASERAITLYESLPEADRWWSFVRERGLGRRYDLKARTTEAYRHLSRAYAIHPDDTETAQRLAHLLQVGGCVFEARPIFHRLIRRGVCRGDELLGVAATERFFRSDERLTGPVDKVESWEPLLRLGEARRMLFENKNDAAEVLLRSVIAEMPELGEAHGRLGRIIADRGDAAEFLSWRGTLAENVREHPEVLLAEGLRARRTGQLEGAINRFAAVLKVAPHHLTATLQLSACLDRIGEKELAERFARRAELLSALETHLNLMRDSLDPELFRKGISVLAELGRFTEAAGWASALRFVEHQQEDPRILMRKYLPLARRSMEQTAAAFSPDVWLEGKRFAEPKWADPSGTPSSARPTLAPVNGGNVAWRFENVASRVGIDAGYFEGTREENRLEHIFNTKGGGLGAFDYDLDGRCDLYVAQANNWREDAPQPQWVDRLFRNAGDAGARDVTSSAWLNETSFSHGVTVGDPNQDGFLDVYVGNLGPNRLYLNQGDGTFRDATVESGTGGNEWSTSAVFADFTADGLPDLYVLNYSLRKETAEKECHSPDGDRMACTPDLLKAERDRFYWNLGDGRFEEVGERVGLRDVDGRGLGVIAWDFAGDGRLGLFVANDTTPNFLFLPTESPDGDKVAGALPVFAEQGAVRGVAYDADGNAQASMGVAAGDVTGDGRLDLFVSNFFGESNTLYVQGEAGFFEDLTRSWQLRDASFWMLGFGTQFADFDGDGWEDIVVSNGHVDQKSSRGDPDRMSPQLFRNVEGRRFVEVPATELGPYFEGRYLGRGLATLDWNGDGRTDFATSPLHGKVALVQNETAASTGSSRLSMQLVGTRGERNPVGAVIAVKTNVRTIHRLWTAGDGFLVTNEAVKHVALGAGEVVVEIEVRWPGRGQPTRITGDGVKNSGVLRVVEGREAGR
jgi:hypothetical protein